MTYAFEVLLIVSLGLIGGVVLIGLSAGEWSIVFGGLAAFCLLAWWVSRDED